MSRRRRKSSAIIRVYDPLGESSDQGEKGGGVNPSLTSSPPIPGSKIRKGKEIRAN